MSRVLVVLDGAPEPGDGPTSLEHARTPALDALSAAGTTGRLATTPPGATPGSETGLPVLLGARPMGRGWVEAAGAGLDVPEGCGAWRVDLRHPGGRRATPHEVAARLETLRRRLPRHRVHALRGHRLLAIGREAPRPDTRRAGSITPGVPEPTRFGCCGGLDAVVWPLGDAPPRDAAPLRATTVVCGPGAAAGIGRLLGARVVVPDGATGDVDTDLHAKTAAALRAMDRGEDVVLHLAGPDEAAHRRDRPAKVAVLEAIDAHVVAPLAGSGALLVVTADHGTCPVTGRHDAAPVPFAATPAGVSTRRLTERAVAGAPVSRTPWPAGALA